MNVNPSLFGKLGAGAVGGAAVYGLSSSLISSAALEDIAGPRKRDRTAADAPGPVGYEQDRTPMVKQLTGITAFGSALLGGGGLLVLNQAPSTASAGRALASAARIGAGSLLLGAGVGGVVGAITAYQSNVGLQPYRRD